MRFAINPLQWYQQPDGTLDFAHKPPLANLLQDVAATGFDAMHAEVFADVADADYARAFEDAGVRPAPGYFSFAPTSDGPGIGVVEAARREAQRHRSLGLDRIFLAVDGIPERQIHPAVGASCAVPLAQRVDAIREVAEAFASEGVTPCFHQHVGTVIESEEELRSVLDGVASLSFGPDLGHMAWAGIDVLAILAEYAHRIGALHVKDCHLDVVRRSIETGLDYRDTTLAGIWDELGCGDLPLVEALDIARGVDPNMWIVIEVDYTQQPTPTQSARECWAWITSWKEAHA